MLNGHDSHEPERRDDRHDRWLAMQSAYAEYRRASKALESGQQPEDDSSAGECLPLTVLEGQQRVAFEHYVEARLEFLESQFDERNRPDAVLADRDTEYSGIASWLAVANRKPVWQILAVLLLCTTTFSLVRKEKQVRDLEATGGELRATLNQTRDELQLLGRKLEAEGFPEQSAIQQVERTTSAPAGWRSTTTPRAAAENQGQPRHHPALRDQPKQVAARKHIAYRFSLAPSRQFKRVGPIEVSLRSVDARRNCVNLSIVSDRGKMEVQRVQMNEPVWIRVGPHQQLLELVVDRIAGNRLDGHLIPTTS
jgi:hypothetical protein